MRDDDRYRLPHGPHAAPACRRGGVLAREVRGEDVRVGGLTDAPIPWPRMLKSGRPALIVRGDLARAVRCESVLAVAHHWGVCEVTVWAWRKALGVPRVNEGTARLYRDYAPEKVDTAESREKMARTMRTPEARARISELKRGLPAHPHTREALLRHARRKKSAAWKRALSERMRRRHEATARRPVDPADRPWTPREDRELGTAPDRAVAAALGRTIPAVRERRRGLGIPPHRHGLLRQAPRPRRGPA